MLTLSETIYKNLVNHMKKIRILAVCLNPVNLNLQILRIN